MTKTQNMHHSPAGKLRSVEPIEKPKGRKVAPGVTAEALPISGFILLAALTLFWGINWPAMKIALGEMRPWTFRTICLVVGGFGLLAIAKTKGFSLRVPRGEFLPLLIVSLLNITSWHIASAYGIMLMNAGRAAIVAYTMPLWSAILSSFILEERLTLTRFLGLGVGLAGLAILVGPDVEALGAAPVGALFMLFAALTWAGGTVALKYFRLTMPTSLLTAWQLIIGGIPVVIGALILEPFPDLSQLSLQGAIAIAYASLVAMIFCHYAWFKIVHLFPATIASIGTLAVPVVGVFSGALILGEPVGVREIVSLALVVSALAIVLIAPNVAGAVKKSTSQPSTAKGGNKNMAKRCIKALEVEGSVKTHGRTSRLLLTESSAGAKGFALGLNITQPGGMSPMHTHEKEQEAMYIISGKGKAIIGGEEYALEPDTVIIAPAGVPHELRNLGNEPIKFIWVYCPPLPEQK